MTVSERGFVNINIMYHNCHSRRARGSLRLLPAHAKKSRKKGNCKEAFLSRRI